MEIYIKNNHNGNLFKNNHNGNFIQKNPEQKYFADFRNTMNSVF